MKIENKEYPSRDRLLESFFYDEFEGSIASTEDEEDASVYDPESGESVVHVDGATYFLADLAWIMSGRQIPDGRHIRSLNLSGMAKYALENLSPDFTKAEQNVINYGKRGGKGFYFDSVRGLFKVQVSNKGKRVSGGYFETQEEASAAVDELRKSIDENRHYTVQRSRRTLPRYVYESGLKYKVLVNRGGKIKYVGTYGDLGEAVIARDEALGEVE